ARLDVVGRGVFLLLDEQLVLDGVHADGQHAHSAAVDEHDGVSAAARDELAQRPDERPLTDDEAVLDLHGKLQCLEPGAVDRREDRHAAVAGTELFVDPVLYAREYSGDRFIAPVVAVQLVEARTLLREEDAP